MTKISGQTRIVGVIGDPVQHSRSPQMHNAAIVERKLDYVYVPFHVRSGELREAIEGFKALNVLGVNVTIPHKQTVMPILDDVSHEATLIGAANTLIFCDGRVSGDNTDAQGFLRAMTEEGIDIPVGGSAVVLGAGGAARAVVVALALSGLGLITVANRTGWKAIQFEKNLATISETEISAVDLASNQLNSAIRSADLLVNTTSVGMQETDQLLIDPDSLNPGTIVYEIVYTPPETPLLRVAREKGCQTIGGIGMLVHQGAIAFEKWIGIVPNVETMRIALEQALYQKKI
ncbi:TPA: shikimate dehydrogenase [Candidatus Poribacteria bacterium]|jgi:shikimate dehydrogenase|nr:shikimate dehydrogenase [Candidatus Poribacteria bacterium]MBD72067.1 shikimate dehydrogenase [Candidatus Poribacteria bacterium]MCS5610208.1 shikimate dehydrogenase [Candidatus Poribacteria bacterium]HCK15047.1 shikimate dehydrogenase [Candidatus Poribacteria bacterium]